MAWNRLQWLGLVPVVLLLHNVEEALTLRGYLGRLQALLPDWLVSVLGSVSLKQGWLALILVSLIGLLMGLPVGMKRDDRLALFLPLAVQAALLLNVISHLFIALRLGGYGPGLASALLLVLPFSLWLFNRAWREQWLPRGDFLVLPLAALVLHGPVLLGVLAMARGLAGLR